MTIDPNSPPQSSHPPANPEPSSDLEHFLAAAESGKPPLAKPPNPATMPRSLLLHKPSLPQPPYGLIIAVSIAITAIGLTINSLWLGLTGIFLTAIFSLIVLVPAWKRLIDELLPAQERSQIIAFFGLLIAAAGLVKYFGWYRNLLDWVRRIEWEAFGTLAEWTGALGQIFIAVLAVYVAWRQYVISRDLTIKQNDLTFQQNVITQQQTIDSYFQGVSELVLDDEGLLEDWPQERLLAEGRTAAILGSVDAQGKAKIIRFLSSSKLLTPLKRDSRLGRAIFDGTGGYAEDREYGVRVIDLGVMLAKADLAGTDLRKTDLSDANLFGANLQGCDLVKANLSRTILAYANLRDADFKGARLFYGSLAEATPRSQKYPPNYDTGAYTGVVIENADLTGADGLSEEQRQYFCAWGGELTRKTIPGGCDGIPDRLNLKGGAKESRAELES